MMNHLCVDIEDLDDPEKVLLLIRAFMIMNNYRKRWLGNTKFAEIKNSKMLPEIPNYINVVPVGDLEPHEERYMEGYECKCEPKIEPCNGSIIVIHNSFDGREGIEIVNEILKQK